MNSFLRLCYCMTLSICKFYAGFVALGKIRLAALFLRAIPFVAEYASIRRKWRNDVKPGPDSALRLQQPLITKNFTSRATGSVICLLKHAGSPSELIIC